MLTHAHVCSRVLTYADNTDGDLEKGWKLQLSGRFAHTEEYVSGLATAHGFKILYHQHFIPRCLDRALIEPYKSLKVP